MTDNIDISKLGAIYSEEHKKLEDNAIIKYEKEEDPHRKKYPRVYKQIRCQNCGSVRSLVKTVHEGKEYWFCKACIEERAKLLKAQENNNSGKIIGEI